MTRSKSEVMAEIEQAIQDPSPEAVGAQGKPVIGYFCSYVPPELVLAAGAHPLRLRGVVAEDSSTGDAYLSHLTCSYARHVASAVIDEAYSFLEGQIAVNSCDHVRRANDAIVAKGGLAYNGYIAAPRSFRGSLVHFYADELSRLKSSLEEHFGRKISDGDLDGAAQKTNAARQRLASLDALRRLGEPRLSGAEFLSAAIAARLLDPDYFVKLADELIAAAKDEDPIKGIRARVILVGGELDEPAFVRVIEGQGAHVAGDMLCFGARGMGRAVEPGPDRLEGLARAYLYQLPCARMMGEFPRRYEDMLQLYKECDARGIVFQRIKFCQIWSNEVHNLRHRFETSPLPMLVLEREYGMVSTGQVKTRVQAFLERLGA